MVKFNAWGLYAKECVKSIILVTLPFLVLTEPPCHPAQIKTMYACVFFPGVKITRKKYDGTTEISTGLSSDFLIALVIFTLVTLVLKYRSESCQVKNRY